LDVFNVSIGTLVIFLMFYVLQD